MFKDYHMHPAIVQNPERFDSFALTAIERGLDEVCITDHIPLSFSDAKDRIPMGQLQKYCENVRKAADKYSGKLNVKLGLEIDYQPYLSDYIEEILKTDCYDWVLGSSHIHVTAGAEIFSKTKNEYAKFMLENTLAAVKSGYFNAIAHIDMYKWVFRNPKRFNLPNSEFDETYNAELIDDILDAIKKAGIRLEINTHLAANTKDISNIYPSRFITGKALEKGVLFSYGSDSHRPEHPGILLDFLHTDELYSKALKTWE